MTVDGIQPIFFIKEPYKKNDRLAVCSSPVSAEEFMPTIMKLITGESKDKTIYDYEADENRSRSVYIRQYKENISDLLKMIQQIMLVCISIHIRETRMN